ELAADKGEARLLREEQAIHSDSGTHHSHRLTDFNEWEEAEPYRNGKCFPGIQESKTAIQRPACARNAAKCLSVPNCSINKEIRLQVSWRGPRQETMSGASKGVSALLF